MDTDADRTDPATAPYLRRGRWGRRLALWVPVLAVLALVSAANLLALRHPLRFDLTSGDVYTMSPESRAVIGSLIQPVRITYFYDMRSKATLDAKALLEQYATASELIELRSYDPVLQPAIARRHGVNFAGTLMVESGDRRIVSSGSGEADFTNTLLRATKDAAQRICFTDGHVESDPFSLKSHEHLEETRGQGHSHSTGGRPFELHERHGMGMARDALEALGYAVKSALLLGGPDALEGCSVVVVASPQQAFLNREAAALAAYGRAGGRLMLMLEPHLQHGLEPVLDLFGVVVDGHGVIDPESHYWTDPATPAVSRYARHRITRNLPLTFFPGATELRARDGGIPNEARVAPIVKSGPAARRADARDNTARARTLAVYASRRLDDETFARAVIIGDGDFATNSFFAILGNGQLFLNAVSFLAEQEALIDIQPRQYVLPRIQLTNRQMTFTFAVSAVVLPVTVLLLGLVVWWRRR